MSSPRPPRVALLVPRLDHRDATTHDAMGMSRALVDQGYEVRYYADGGNAPLKIHRPDRIRSFLTDSSDILIYHYAIAWLPAVKLLEHGPYRKVIKYHNVTPPEFFEPYNPSVAEACRRARQDFPEILRFHPNRILVDSRFNALDVNPSLYDPSEVDVVFPFHKIEEFRRESIDWKLLDRTAMTFPNFSPLFLMVGRVVPNKGHDFLLRSFGILKRFLPGARLLIVGSDNKAFASYSSKLRTILKQQELSESVQFSGSVDQKTLYTAYLTATAFVMPAFHEGFCVPVVEAMASGLPVISLKNGALSETVGEAGILCENDETEFASAMFSVATDYNIRMDLIERGRKRYLDRFTNESIEKMFLNSIENISAGTPS